MEENKDVSSLRYYAKNRILNDMMKAVKLNANKSDDTFFLIADDWSLKTFSSICKLPDLINMGIAGIEKLELRRKRFPHSDVIYFITPCVASIHLLLKDFKASIQYGYVHLCFTNKLSQFLMAEIVASKLLSSRIKSIFEINLDFYIHENDYFNFGLPKSLSFYKTEDNSIIDRYLDQNAKKLFSICNSFNEFPYIQFSTTNVLCLKLADKLSKELKSYYANNENVAFKAENRATLLILDRSFDLSTPLIHDMSYESLVYDLVDINLDDNSIKHEGKKAKLNEEDELWMRTKLLHIAESMNIISTEFKEFAKQNKEKGILQNNELQNLEIDAVASIIKNMPKYEELMKIYSTHLNIAAQCVKGFQDNNLKNAVDIEQSIVSGVDVHGKEIDGKHILSSIIKISENLNEDDIFRIILLFFINYNVDMDKNEPLVSLIKDENNKFALKNLLYLDIMYDKNSKNLSRRIPRINEKEVHTYLQKQENSNFDVLRKISPIARIVHKAIHKRLPLEEYHFIEQPIDYEAGTHVRNDTLSSNNTGTQHNTAVSKRVMRPYWGAAGVDLEKEETPKMIVFVLGGISYQEIVEIGKLKQTMKIIAGGSSLITSKNMVDMLKELHKDKLFDEKMDLKKADTLKTQLTNGQNVKKKKWWLCGL